MLRHLKFYSQKNPSFRPSQIAEPEYDDLQWCWGSEAEGMESDDSYPDAHGHGGSSGGGIGGIGGGGGGVRVMGSCVGACSPSCPRS